MVVNGDGQAARRDDLLYYAPPPEITALTDLSGDPVIGGSTAGGQQFRVVGTGLSEETIVLFGSLRGTDAAPIGTTRLNITSPAHGPQAAVQETLEDEFGRKSAHSVDFEFKTAPTIGATPYDPGVVRIDTQTVVALLRAESGTSPRRLPDRRGAEGGPDRLRAAFAQGGPPRARGPDEPLRSHDHPGLAPAQTLDCF